MFIAFEGFNLSKCGFGVYLHLRNKILFVFIAFAQQIHPTDVRVCPDGLQESLLNGRQARRTLVSVEGASAERKGLFGFIYNFYGTLMSGYHYQN